MASLWTMENLIMALYVGGSLLGLLVLFGIYWLMIRPVFRWIRLRLWYLAKFLKLTKTDKPPLLWRFDKYSYEDCGYGLLCIETENYTKHRLMNDTEYLSRHDDPNPYWLYRSFSEVGRLYDTVAKREQALFDCEKRWSN